MCFYVSILTFVVFFMQPVNLHNIFIDVSRINLPVNDCDERHLFIFIVSLVVNYINTFI